ncbi:TerB family tellurite resistance protein [Candidatus Puniceispirillum sp.]|nr:TerB family tellurite resistance protein [Candidatus Puniceispirillum sp.]
MSIWGIIIGGTAGFAFGGPIGGLLGAMAGHAVESKLVPSGPVPQATKRVAFTVAVIALSAKMAKADGVVSRDEIKAFRARVHIPSAEVRQVGRFWDLARQTPDGFEEYAKQVARLFEPRTPVLEQLLDLLFHIAQSDGDITTPELSYLYKVAEIFGFNQTDFDRLLALHQSNGPNPYEILGVRDDVSDRALHKHWKHLARTHHPDTLTADGMPEEFIVAANDRLAKINAAYDAIMRHRSL